MLIQLFLKFVLFVFLYDLFLKFKSFKLFSLDNVPDLIVFLFYFGQFRGVRIISTLFRATLCFVDRLSILSKMLNKFAAFFMVYFFLWAVKLLGRKCSDCFQFFLSKIISTLFQFKFLFMSLTILVLYNS